MKRICIYIIYDSHKTIHNYIGYMLSELKSNCDFLAVVCNNENIEAGAKNIEPYADKIFYRKNIGLDAGAYKDALTHLIGWDTIYQYDELILANDSFFGPVYPLKNSFGLMSDVEADFWGMTRSPEGFREEIGNYNSHIQSYFLVFRNKILHSRAFHDFFSNLEPPVSFYDAVNIFELELNSYMEKCGFKGISQMDLFPFGQTIMKGENPYLSYPLELIRDCKIPILKRKVFSYGLPHANEWDVLKYIDQKTSYDISLIKDYLGSIPGSEGSGKIDYQELERFYHSHDKIYIYGAGICGRNLAHYFEYKGWFLEGYIVSKNSGSDGYLEIETANIAENDGVIIAVIDKNICGEILENLLEKCRTKQIFMFDYGDKNQTIYK